MSIKNAIIKAKVNGVLTELMVRTDTDNVLFKDGTSEVTLSSKLASIIADVALKANKTEVTSEINAAISALLNGAPETYDTLKEISDYISTHADVVDALNAAIGQKAAQSDLTALQTAFNELKATVDGLGALAKKSKVSESDLDAALAEKVNAAAEGNHSHANKTELDKITDGDKAKWDQATTDVNAIKADYLKNADKYDDTALAGRVSTIEGDYLKNADKYDDTALQNKVNTLIGEDANKSARTIASEELAKQLVAEGAAESLDTLAEIAAWIQSHPGDASAMNQAITALQNKVDTGDKNVSAYVADAIAALKIGDYAKAEALTALAERVTTLEGASHAHANKDVLDGISAEKVATWDSAQHNAIEKVTVNGVEQSVTDKTVNLSTPVVYAQASEPTNLKDGDLFLQIVD